MQVGSKRSPARRRRRRRPAPLPPALQRRRKPEFPLDHLYFGPKARARAHRNAKIKRLALYAWVGTFAATAFGISVPGPGVALELLSGVERGDRIVRAAAGGLETSEVAVSNLRFRQRMFVNRLTPSPSATEGAAPAGSVTEIITSAAAEFGVSGDWMIAIAECESGLDPGAYNPAGYHGLFQYDQTTWAGNGYGSIYDPVAQARTTARLLSLGQSSRWPNCS